MIDYCTAKKKKRNLKCSMKMKIVKKFFVLIVHKNRTLIVVFLLVDQFYIKKKKTGKVGGQISNFSFIIGPDCYDKFLKLISLRVLQSQCGCQ